MKSTVGQASLPALLLGVKRSRIADGMVESGSIFCQYAMIAEPALGTVALRPSVVAKFGRIPPNTANYKFFQNFSSYEILRHMHGVLNIDEKN
jgi:hypothetical protein